MRHRPYSTGQKHAKQRDFLASNLHQYVLLTFRQTLDLPLADIQPDI